jgi:hypothetical protein
MKCDYYTLRQKIADFLTYKRIKFKTNNFSEPGNKFTAHQSWIANYREIFKTHLLYFLPASTVGLQSHGCCVLLFCRWAGKVVVNEQGCHALVISPALLEDGGEVGCIAQNRSGEASFTVCTSPNSSYHFYLIMNILRHSFQL